MTVCSDGSFGFEPTVIWRSKGPRCFKSINDPPRPISVHYFSNKKAWMNSDTMESILLRLDRKMCREKRKVVLFWENATCHSETLQASLTNIKLVFLPKNTTSRLQSLDAGIIRNFKHKYRKLLVRYVVSRIDEGKTASQIIEGVHVLKAITWLQPACKSVSTETIKHCFKKCGFDVGNVSVINEEIDNEFQELFAQISSEATLDEYIDFEADTSKIGKVCSLLTFLLVIFLLFSVENKSVLNIWNRNTTKTKNFQF